MRFSNRQLTAFTATLALAGSLTGAAVAQAAPPAPPGPGTGNFLWGTPYYFWSGNAVAVDATPVHYNDPVEIDVEATSYNSSGGSCTYRLDLIDDNTGADLGMTVNTRSRSTTSRAAMRRSRTATWRSATSRSIRGPQRLRSWRAVS